jgi:hypothetical protein
MAPRIAGRPVGPADTLPQDGAEDHVEQHLRRRHRVAQAQPAKMALTGQPIGQLNLGVQRAVLVQNGT